MMIGGRKLIQEQLRYDTTRSEGQGEPYCDALPLKSNMCEPEAPLITLTKTLGSSGRPSSSNRKNLRSPMNLGLRHDGRAW